MYIFAAKILSNIHLLHNSSYFVSASVSHRWPPFTSKLSKIFHMYTFTHSLSNTHPIFFIVSLFHSFPLSLSYLFSILISLCLCIYISGSFSLPPTFSPSPILSYCFIPSLSLDISHSHFYCTSLFLFVILSVSLPLYLSFSVARLFPSVTLSLPFNPSISLFLSLWIWPFILVLPPHTHAHMFMCEPVSVWVRVYQLLRVCNCL